MEDLERLVLLEGVDDGGLTVADEECADVPRVELEGNDRRRTGAWVVLPEEVLDS